MNEDKQSEKQSPITHFGDKINTWKPGQSGNPAGRPPNKRYLSEIARQLMKEARKGDLDNKTTDELVVLALVKEALKGNTKAIEMLHDWTEGKVPDKHQIETGDISIVYKQVRTDAEGAKED